MGSDEVGSAEGAMERAKADNRKWVGVRLSKVMMAQIEDTVDAHPEWAWSNPNDFVRDAVRRHLEYVRQQTSVSKQNLLGLHTKVLALAAEIMDSPSHDLFKQKLIDIMSEMDIEREPIRFLDSATDLLASFLGETLAKNVIRRLYEEIE